MFSLHITSYWQKKIIIIYDRGESADKSSGKNHFPQNHKKAAGRRSKTVYWISNMVSKYQSFIQEHPSTKLFLHQVVQRNQKIVILTSRYHFRIFNGITRFNFDFQALTSTPFLQFLTKSPIRVIAKNSIYGRPVNLLECADYSTKVITLYHFTLPLR